MMLRNSLKSAQPSSEVLESLFPVLRILGLLQACFGTLMFISVALGFFYKQPTSAWIFLGCGTASIILGLGASYFLRRHRRELTPRDGVLLVTLTWLWLPLISCIPLFITLYAIGRPLDFSHAYFEAVSGLTTTGNTVLTDLDALPIALSFWRNLMQWLGGLGVIILAVAILPMMGTGAMQLLRVEMAGPLKDSKLTPRISSTAKGLWSIYVIFSVLCALAYWLAGMEPLDAIMYMFSTISLGGLTPHDNSLAYFNSPIIELIAVIFMFIGSVSFALYFIVYRNRSFNALWKNPEAKATFATLIIFSYVSSFLLWIKTDYTFIESLRYGIFQTMSIATTTAYTTVDFSNWPAFIPVMLILLSAVTTGAGSTGGGIKMIRMLILSKQVEYEVKRMIHPRAIRPVTIANQIIEQPVVFSVLAFMMVYGATIIFLSMILILTDIDIITAFSAIMASVNCMGIGLGEVGPSGSFAHFNSFQIWTCTFAMLLGRLEMLSFFAILMPSFWKK